MPDQYTRQATTQRILDANVREKLQQMKRDKSFITRASSYSANTNLYSNNKIPFVEQHIAYLMDHPKVNCEQYLSNLRLMLRIRH